MADQVTRRAVMAAPLAMALASGPARAAAPGLRQAPAVVRVEGRRRALFELWIDRTPITTVSVRDAGSGALLRTFEGHDLEGRRVTQADGAVVFVELDLPVSTKRLAIAAGDQRVEADLPPDPGPMLGPPLRGGPWVAIYKAEWPRGHRRVFYAPDGKPRLPGRTAIDWVRVDDRGQIATGDADLARNALGYGAEVLAVADATVAAARDGVPEAARLSDNGKHPEELAAGNYVSLDLGGGRHAIYEHLIPGSLRVKVGDRVRRGQVIGHLGFSGDSTGPHLHLHVADAARPLLGEGVGYGFERFTLLGRYDDLGRLGSAPWSPLAGLDPKRRDELPGSNVVVRFTG
ncbi:M23 family metallopeptidase [Caulobacter sp. 1776]|uniref:M23 family metallopeptidase n=1 Tax=Caulobacter sp. 1776 TaxID=3156420 RepID=UPI0033957908